MSDFNRRARVILLKGHEPWIAWTLNAEILFDHGLGKLPADHKIEGPFCVPQGMAYLIRSASFPEVPEGQAAPVTVGRLIRGEWRDGTFKPSDSVEARVHRTRRRASLRQIAERIGG